MNINEKKYNRFSDYLKKKYGKKIIKISLNAGFTCPNIDGTKAYGGCIYCSNKGSGDFAGVPSDDLVTQFNDIKDKMSKKWKTGLYLPYFQAYSNTYAPLDVLKEKYESVLYLDNVIGIDIATRPDCLEDDLVDYLAELSKTKEVWVELGLQSIYDETAKIINRGHDFNEFLIGLNKLRAKNINVCVHIINGLPYETYEMMMNTLKKVNELDIQAIKIHLLHVLKDTPLANMYKKGKFKVMEKMEYVNLVVDQLELLRPEILVQRVTGDGARDELIAPLWSLKKFELLNEIDWEFLRRKTKQGYRYNKMA